MFQILIYLINKKKGKERQVRFMAFSCYFSCYIDCYFFPGMRKFEYNYCLITWIIQKSIWEAQQRNEI